MCLSERYLPEQHRQQQEDEDSHEEADGDDPSHHVTPGLLTVKGLKHQLQDNTKRVNIHTPTRQDMTFSITSPT